MGYGSHVQVYKNIKQLFLTVWGANNFQYLRIHSKRAREFNIEFLIYKTEKKASLLISLGFIYPQGIPRDFPAPE